MNPYPYPISASREWFDLNVLNPPYPEHLKTVALIKKGLKEKAYFVDTLCGPTTIAWSLFSKKGVSERDLLAADSDPNMVHEYREFQNSRMDLWVSAMEAITESTINHITN